jgi:hypothetical protein
VCVTVVLQWCYSNVTVIVASTLLSADIITGSCVLVGLGLLGELGELRSLLGLVGLVG